MSAPTISWNFPFQFETTCLSGLQNNVCVVSVIGKSQYSSYGTKAADLLNTIINTEAFTNKDVVDIETGKLELECYYDDKNHVIYLHLSSVVDSTRLGDLCSHGDLADPDKAVYEVLQNEEYAHAKMLLFLFSISHIIILSNPGSSFDMTYVRMFRNLDIIRTKLQPYLTDILHDFSLPKAWIASARPCAPRVLFVFRSHLLDMSCDGRDGSRKDRSQTLPMLRKLQHAIEDQIYRILRKTRIITNISNNSLFAVPANQEFVYICTQTPSSCDPVTVYLHKLQQACNPQTTSGDLATDNTNAGFQQFLCQHIEQAFGKGFDDNVGRHPVQAIFEIVSLEVWSQVAHRLYEELFSVDNVDKMMRTSLTALRSLLETDLRFSETRCNKILPLAESAYQDGLPSHYTRDFHLHKLNQAQKVFIQHARGPAFDKYSAQLEEACNSWWQNGCELCEQSSLTGKHCTSPLHRLASDGENETNKHLPIMQHCSGLKTRAACNCGRTQSDREDPFHHKAANFVFYATLLEECCGQLQHINMPVFTSSTENAKPADVAKIEVLVEMDTGTKHEASPGYERNSPGIEEAGVLSQGGVASPVDVRNSPGIEEADVLSQGRGGASLLNATRRESHSAQSGHEAVSDDADLEGGAEVREGHPVHSDVAEADAVQRQVSTVEYLAGMLHSESPLGLLPLFSSWNLCSLGTASTYSSAQGIDQPGFMHGSNFLLPWDITVKWDHEKWPTVGETAGKKGKQKRVARTLDTGEMTVRAYLGTEYECPRGHRFFCSAPDKVIKVATTSLVKDTAGKLVTMDMPLYTGCPCRNTKGFLAQLMRLYVVTPEGPIRIVLNPIIQPAPQPCPLFHPEAAEPIQLLPDQFWVMRLPYIYSGDAGPYLPPSSVTHLSEYRLLRDCYSYKVITGVD